MTDTEVIMANFKNFNFSERRNPFAHYFMVIISFIWPLCPILYLQRQCYKNMNWRKINVFLSSFSHMPTIISSLLLKVQVGWNHHNIFSTYFRIIHYRHLSQLVTIWILSTLISTPECFVLHAVSSLHDQLCVRSRHLTEFKEKYGKLLIIRHPT